MKIVSILALALLGVGLGGCHDEPGPYASAQGYVQQQQQYHYSGRKRCPDCVPYRTDGNPE